MQALKDAGLLLAMILVAFTVRIRPVAAAFPELPDRVTVPAATTLADNAPALLLRAPRSARVAPAASPASLLGLEAPDRVMLPISVDDGALLCGVERVEQVVRRGVGASETVARVCTMVLSHR